MDPKQTTEYMTLDSLYQDALELIGALESISENHYSRTYSKLAEIKVLIAEYRAKVKSP